MGREFNSLVLITLNPRRSLERWTPAAGEKKKKRATWKQMKPSVPWTLQVLLLISCSLSLPNPKLDKHISAEMRSSHQSTLHSEIQKDSNFGIEYKFILT